MSESKPKRDRDDPNSEPVEDDVPHELEEAASQNAEYPADETDEG